jgi:hypothetical protein
MSFKSISIVAAAALSMCAGAAHALATANGFANGGFEAPANGAGEFADNWQKTSANTTLSTDAHSGSFSAQLAIPDPGFNGTGLFQNSVDHGGLLALDPSNWGTSPTLTFWAKGSASVTGNVNYSLRYLDSIGNILNPVQNTSFGGLINPTTWTQITKSGVVIPTNTSAVFLEMTLAVGPTGITVNPDNSVSDYGQARVLVDDVNLSVAAVPEPESYAMMLAGLGAIGSIVRRRRAV